MGQLYSHEELSVTTNKRSCEFASEDKKLDLRLGPPGDQDHSQLGFITSDHEAKRVCLALQVKGKNVEKQWSANTSRPQPNPASYFKLPMIPHSNRKEYSELVTYLKCPSSAAENGYDEKSRIRIAQAPVVGWPPVNSFRRNLANKSSLAKPASDESPVETLTEKSKGKSVDCKTKEHLYVKINMEGVPLGRKINLKAYDCYEQLSSAIEDLFQGLLAVQRDYCSVEKENKEGTKSIRDSYTLLYEDNEGDMMLVGDAPWNMFVSAAKRLLVLKSSRL